MFFNFFTKRKRQMRARRLHADFAVGPLILPEELADVAAAGFRAVICNLPNGEARGHDFAEIAAAARAAGIEAVHLPVSGWLDAKLVDAFATEMARLPKPVYAYCRSGGRSAALWQNAQARVAAGVSKP